MRRLRGFTALFAAAALGQLMLVGSGYACTVHRAEMDGMPGMAGMTLSTEASTAAVSPATDVPPPCDFPWLPAGCHSAGPCVPPAMSEASIAAVSVGAIGVQHIWHSAAMHSVARSPEPPPPKA